MVKDSFKEAMKGCSIVSHCIFKLDIKDAQKELINPAVEGTKNVLNTANNTNAVKRVVLTSSVAAMYSDASECLQYENNEITESIWNSTASLSYQPYSFSKTIAEKIAWEINAQQDNWDLVVINPSLVLGPFLNGQNETSESFKILKQIGDGTFKKWIPKMGIGLVDVRDVANAHFLAAFSKNAKGRYITNAHNTNLLDISKELYSIYGKSYSIPNKPAPAWLIWLIGPSVKQSINKKIYFK